MDSYEVAQVLRQAAMDTVERTIGHELVQPDHYVAQVEIEGARRYTLCVIKIEGS